MHVARTPRSRADGRPAPAAAQPGFTLVELVVVIAILSILAAVALPKFTDLRSPARIAKMKAYAGALEIGVVMAAGKWQAAGRPTAGITLDDGTVVEFTSNGYPTAATVKHVLQSEDRGGIYALTSSTTTAFCDANWSGNTNCGTPPPSLGQPYTYCAFIYTAPTTAGATYAIDSTSYLNASNCQ